MTSSTFNRQGTQSGLSQNLKNGLLGGGLAAVVSLLIFFIGSALVGPIEVAQQPGAPVMPLPWFMIIVATLVPGLVAGLLLTGLQRFSARGTRLFQGIAVLVALLSLFPALTQAGSTGAALVLALLHLVSAAAIVWALTLRQP